MRLPVVRLTDIVEILAISAVGLAIFRMQWTNPTLQGFRPNLRISQWLPSLVEPTLLGIALAGGLGLWWESARRRGPSSWGLGRWAWGFSGAFVLLQSAVVIAQDQASQIWWSGKLAGWEHMINILTFTWDMKIRISPVEWHPTFAWFLAAGLIATRLGRPVAHLVPDLREWTGRAFAAAVLIGDIALRGLAAFGL